VSVKDEIKKKKGPLKQREGLACCQNGKDRRGAVALAALL
jgi:hypothetical protein